MNNTAFGLMVANSVPADSRLLQCAHRRRSSTVWKAAKISFSHLVERIKAESGSTK